MRVTVKTPSRLMATALLAVSLCASVSARAAEEPTPTQIREAAEAFDRGREAYKGREWVTAAEQFERADAQAGSPTALEYAIRSREKAGQLDRAATLAALVVKRYPEQAALVKFADELLTRARSSQFELSVSCGAPCDLAVGGKIVPGTADVQRTIFLAPGEASVKAGFGSRRSEAQQVDAEAGGHGQILFDAPTTPQTGKSDDELARDPEPEAPKAPPPKVERHSGWSPAVFWVGVGLTAAVGGVTIWSGVDTLSNPGKQRIKDECDAGDSSCPTYKSALSHQLRTNVLIGATAGVGVATVLIGILATDWKGSPEPAAEPEPAGVDEYVSRRRPRTQHARVLPWVVLGNGALVGAEGRF
jgi:hypothetical protein